MIELEEQLRNLAPSLQLDETDLVERVMAEIDTSHRTASIRHGGDPGRRRWALAAAAVIVLVVAVVAAIPGPRRTVARWFGLDGVTVELRPDLSVPASVPSSFDLPGPGASRVVTVDSREILVSALEGRLTDGSIGKTVGGASTVEQVVVSGSPGLWISGAPHEVVYETIDGSVTVRRFAADTLLWQVDDTLYRVEGFDDLDAALTFAVGLTG